MSQIGWYGHVERVADDRLVTKIYCSAVKGRPRRRWVDFVRDTI